MNSYGWDVIEAFAIYNLLKNYKDGVTVTISAMAASAAAENGLEAIRAANMPAAHEDGKYPMVNYTVYTKKQEVRMHSFPANLFETGRVFRSGKTQAGLWVMRSAKPTLRIHEYAASAMKTVLEDTGKGNPFSELAQDAIRSVVLSAFSFYFNAEAQNIKQVINRLE